MKKLAKGILGSVGLYFVLALFLVFAGVEDSNPLNDFLGAVNMIFLAMYIFGVIRENKFFTVGAYVLVIIMGLLCLGAAKDFPYFIRKIPGEEVTRIIVIYVIIVFPVILFLVRAGISVYLRCKVNKAKQEIYSDSDLLLLQGGDRYKMTGYYLLKARLHRIINYKEVKNEEMQNSSYSVEVNPELSGNVLEEYCEANPQVKKIVHYIAAQKEAGEENVRVADIIYQVKPTPEISSEGGKVADGYIKKAASVGNTVFGLYIFIFIYGALTKLMMGILNEKPTEFLVGFTILGLIVVCVIYNNTLNNREKLVKKVFVDKIIKFKSANFKNIYQLFQQTDFENTGFSEEEITRLLRAYVVYEPEQEDRLGSGDESRYFAAIFAGVRAAHIRAKAENRSVDTIGGCSGCGGCGGGCDGCGGCGGCGD